VELISQTHNITCLLVARETRSRALLPKRMGPPRNSKTRARQLCSHIAPFLQEWEGQLVRRVDREGRVDGMFVVENGLKRSPRQPIRRSLQRCHRPIHQGHQPRGGPGGERGAGNGTAALVPSFTESRSLIPIYNKVSAMIRKAPGRNHGVEPAGAWRVLSLFALIMVLLVLRRPDAVANPQFWAEDGVVFFRDSIVHGAWGSLFRPCAGYLNLIPRLAAALASLFPARDAPLIFNLCAFTIAAMCCSLFSLTWYRHIVKSDWLRTLLCILMATAFYVDELIGSITNIQWYLVVAALLLLLLPTEAYEQATPWLRYMPAASCLLIGLTAPLTMLLIPLGIWYAARRKGSAKLAPVAVVVAALLQVCILVLAGGPVSSGDPDQLIASSLMSVTYLVVLTSILGCPLTQAIAHGVALGTLVALTVWLTSMWWGSDTYRRWQLAVSVYLIFASVVLAMSGRPLAKVFASPGSLAGLRNERYFFLGACLFACLVAVSIERWMPRWNRATQALVLLVVFAGGIWGNFRTTPFADFEWRAYGPAVDRWLRAVRSGRSVASLSIPINPPPWKLELPASRGSGALPIDPLVSKWEGRLVRKPGTSIQLRTERSTWWRMAANGGSFNPGRGPRAVQAAWRRHDDLLPGTERDSGRRVIAPASRYEGQLVHRPGPTPEDGKVYIK
jgi:hypothetical protein